MIYNGPIEVFYRFREFYISKRMEGGIRRYIEEGILPGSFLKAVINNDLRSACTTADDENIKNLPAYIGYFYYEAPSECWGSKERMCRWIEQFRKNEKT